MTQIISHCNAPVPAQPHLDIAQRTLRSRACGCWDANGSGELAEAPCWLAEDRPRLYATIPRPHRRRDTIMVHLEKGGRRPMKTLMRKELVLGYASGFGAVPCCFP